MTEAATSGLVDAVDLSQVKRALIIKLRHHGDVLLSSPVFSVLKSRAPHIEIDALVYADTQEMLSLHPAISQLHTIDRAWKTQGVIAQGSAEWKLWQSLKARRYDLVIHLTEHRRGMWLAKTLGARHRVAPQLKNADAMWSESFTHFYKPVPRGNSRHTVETNLDALRRIGVQPAEDEKALTLIAGAAASTRVEALLAQHQVGAGFIHIHPTSRWMFKTWPSERVAQLIDTLQSEGRRIVLTAAPAEKELAMIARITSLCAAPPINFAGQLSLKELAALTRRATLFIGVDSAPMHISASQGTPTVALFGPSGEIEWGPWKVSHRVIVSNAHPCRPCGQDGCGGSKVSECLTTLPVAQVLDAAHTLLPV
jgi:heptosyltransferase III